MTSPMRWPIEPESQWIGTTRNSDFRAVPSNHAARLTNALHAALVKDVRRSDSPRPLIDTALMAAALKPNGHRINIGTGERLASAIGGGLLALYGWRRRSWTAALPLAAVGATFVTRAATGHSRLYDQLGIDTAHARPVSLTLAVTVYKPRNEVYGLWRQLQNLPRFMRHLQSVQQTTPIRSHWIAKAPASGTRVEWDAEIIEDRPAELIRWQSLPGSDIENDGRVEFHAAPGDRGTEVRVWLEYRTARGVRTALASLMTPISEPMLEQEIKRFKSVMEAGEAPTTEGQPRAHV